MRVIPMDESDSQQPQPDPLTNTMQPLDIRDLAITWPTWQQQFQIYLLAIHDQVSERRKLAIFLNCLGPDGIAVATQFFPQLKDFQSVAAQEITFEQLWSLFNGLCAKATPPAVNSFEDSFDFYAMIKHWQFDGNLSATYPELLEAANKCDFRCHVCQTSYTDRMVRDQLMHLIHEEEHIIIRDLLKLKNPNSQALISKYNDILKVSIFCGMLFSAHPSNQFLSLVFRIEIFGLGYCPTFLCATWKLYLSQARKWIISSNGS